MKAINRHSITAILFLLVAFFLGAATIANIGMRYLAKKKEHGGSEKLMEVIEDRENHAAAKGISKKKARFALLGKIEAWRNFSTTLLDKEFVFKPVMVDLFGALQHAMGKQIIDDMVKANVVYKDSRGELLFVAKQSDVSTQVSGIIRLRKEVDCPVLFMVSPYKYQQGFTELPYGVTDTANASADKVLSALREHGVDCIDFRDEVDKDGLDKDTLFYKTDHHWTTETAFWAYTKLVHTLKQQYGFTIDRDGFYTNLDNFEKVRYADYLGSQGRRVGKFYAGTDNFTYITPKFDTEYETYNPFLNRRLTGSFTQVMTDKSDKGYDLYLNKTAGPGGKLIITNKRQKQYKILMIKDSFSQPFTPFLSLVVNEVFWLDLRLTYAETLPAMVRNYKPDIIIFLLAPNTIREQVFKFD